MLPCLGHSSAKKSRTKNLQRPDFQLHVTSFVPVGTQIWTASYTGCELQEPATGGQAGHSPSPHCVCDEVLS